MDLEDLPDVKSSMSMIRDAKQNYWAVLGEDKKQEILQLEKEFTKLIEGAKKYEEYFSDKGWVNYSSLKPEYIYEAVEAYENESLEIAEEVILEHYSPDSVEAHRLFLRGAEASRIRLDLVDLAYIDYRAGLYHAVVLNLITIIDGIVNDVLGVGFHSKEADVDCWGNITGVDGSIYKVKEIYCTTRRKTRTEQIDAPYRHGILHGRDLGYANKTVAAKCWCFLFVVADWAKAKETEEQRKTEIKPQTLLETAQQEREFRAKHLPILSTVAAFKEHHLTHTEIEAINLTDSLVMEKTPEARVLNYLRCWARKNYGGMSSCYSKYAATRPEIIRGTIGKNELTAYEFVDIHNRAASASNVSVRVTYVSGKVEEKAFILTFDDKEGKTAFCNMPNPGDDWFILDIQDGFWMNGVPASVAKAKAKTKR